jgi:hypothetical protein
LDGRPFPRELNQPLPRRARPTGMFKFLIGSFTVMFPGMGLVILCLMLAGVHRAAVLKANGVPIEAVVTDLHVERHKSSLVYLVGYRFQASSLPNGRLYNFSNHRGVSEDRYGTLQVGQVVPILYERGRPENSDLNFDDSLLTSDPYRRLPILVLIACGTFGGIYAVVMAFMLFTYFRDKKLVQWGRAARAVIVKQDEVYGRYLSMTATYQFTDDRGRTITGVQKDMPTKRRPWLGDQAYQRDVIDNPIALYDPENSERSRLYRASGMVVCELP